MRIRLLLITALLMSACAGQRRLSSTESDLIPVGVARIDITPEEPIRLSGYGSREAPSEGIAQRLWAKALAFGDGEPGILITADLIGFPGSLTESVAKRISERTGIPRAQIVLLATHTHSGPVVLGTIPNIFGGRLPAEQLATINRYTIELSDKLVQVALDAFDSRRPARVDWGKGEAGFAMNRRIVKDGRWTGFGANPEGPSDHELPVMRITEPDGTVRAILLNYACHCTTLFGSFNEIHGDWAATAAELIEAEHPGSVALVTIGTAGDQDPQPRGELAHVQQHGEELAREVRRVTSGAMQRLNAAPRGRMKTVELPYEDVPETAELIERTKLAGAAGFHAQMMLDRVLRGERLPETLTYPVQVWTFGDDLAMVFLAGEVVVDYGLRLKREFENVWVNAYANDLVCYIASERIIPEGGYEVDASMYYYDRPSRFSTRIEDLIIEAVHDLLPEDFAR